MSFRSLALAAGAVLGLSPLSQAVACPFCSSQGQTLSGEVATADLIVMGTMQNAKRDPNDFTKGTTDLVIETVVKDHDYLRGKKVLVIPRAVEGTGKDTKFLVYASLYPKPEQFPASAIGSAIILANPMMAQLDPYRGEPVKADSKLPEYLKGAIEVRAKDTPTRLKYFFDYLDAADLTVGADAMNEFGNADYKDVRLMAEKLPAAKIVGWMKDKNTPASRFGLYGLLLAHCGKKDDAKALRELLEEKDRVYSSGLDGIIAAYIMLDKDAGWQYLIDLLKDPKKEFPVRYAGLKVLRFFWEYRPDVVKKDDVLIGMRHLVTQSDMADLPMEDLRKWGCWSETGFVLQFAGQESHNKVPIVRRAILRFALAAPADQKEAKAFVEQARQTDADRVKQIEQLLEDEKPKPPAAVQKPAPTTPGGS